MKRWFLVALLSVAALCATYTRAQTATCTVTFADGAILHAIQLSNLQSCINNIDRQNIGAAGIDASQIIPSSAGAATFGGSTPYTFNVSVMGNAAASLPSFSGFNGPMVVAQATSAPVIQPGSIGIQRLTVSNPIGNTVMNLTASSGLKSTFNAIGGATSTSFPLFNFEHDYLAANLANMGQITWVDKTFTHSTLSAIWSDAIGTTSTDLGGAIIFGTKPNASGSLTENLVLDHGGHVRMGQDVLDTGVIATPGTCAANVNCGTYTFTFPNPFIDINSAAQTPICSGAIVQDATGAATLWNIGINAVSSTAITFNFGPTAALAVTHNIDITFNCYTRNY